MSALVTYRFPKGADPQKLGNKLAVGQTAGSWSERWEHRTSSFQAHLAEVVSTATSADGHPTATVSFPTADLEGDLGSLLTLIFGKFSMAGPIKVLRIELPEEFGRKPKFGMNGLRQQLGVPDRPLLMAIFKPALGLSAQEHGEILTEVGLAGIDLVKDDEIMADLASAPTRDRLAAGLRALDTIEAKTGKRPLYAVNCTGGGGAVVDRARALQDAGANALLLNGLTYGWHTVEQVCDAVEIPVLLHPALAGALCGAPDHGFSYATLLGTLAAHSGVDAVLYPAHYGSMPFDPAQEAAIRDALRARGVAPVPSAGIHPGVVPRALADYGTQVVLNAGTGIMDHPSGPAAGVRAFYEALDVHARGEAFDPAQLPEGPLKRALALWGSP
ncbi:MAG: 2,3-diketo-5-methylthiopentyl-1-phosphate enolase [Deltaproteobacteria bacterium]|nr:MAG: 2,3-diketo-5-methylthiopentyl-1-phosphate enolase [Deltaproteobacteria bacterium]